MPSSVILPKLESSKTGEGSLEPIAVIGAGAWGTALALLASSKGIPVYLWARRAQHAQAMQEERQNREYLPGVLFPESLHPTADAEEALQKARFAVVAVPSKAFRETLALLPEAPAYVSVTKGLQFADHHLLRMSQVIEEITGVGQIAVLSGPNLADEIARFLPAAAVVASRDPELALEVQQVFSGASFRVYTSSDVVGVELGGALKNVIALAAGMVDGLKLGDNAKAALITRGLREIIKFGVAQGASEATFMGLSGLGDLIATASSPLSRNRSAGERIVKGETMAHLEAQKSVVEGIYTVKALHAWDQETGADLPITEAVYRVVFEGADPMQELSRLMGRETKSE
ncbi:NAD(P)H-dependent glycerol-3-phosphate dehydrogenase [Meiothermus sp. CFH 77666]|uniref:NAD(P)H-dependent glycerol-3-phosphate dehydrogenase n=1 Tax=Meiothermus sp. CFH 77666 TaxID=2817942 RepID=UPI001AA02BA5|nr:NAD(P)H-dependent glycerol-3-phosphate dehydrogenase [Meiothermus sp. CFH 77666]MBO1436990.1 NAD(P)H-dependent glycerol-3-phosphate dehydrogenase [Meiothermus sp. CFH 77666]